MPLATFLVPAPLSTTNEVVSCADEHFLVCSYSRLY